MCNRRKVVAVEDLLKRLRLKNENVKKQKL